MITLLTLCVICLAGIILIPVILAIVGLPLLVLWALLSWLLRIAAVILLIRAMFEQPYRWENFIPAVAALLLAALLSHL